MLVVPLPEAVSQSVTPPPVSPLARVRPSQESATWLTSAPWARLVTVHVSLPT